MRAEVGDRFRDLIKEKKYEQVIEEGRNSLDDPVVRFRVGVAYHRLGSWSEAICEYLRTLSMVDPNTDAEAVVLNAIGQWLDDRTLYTEAIAVWESCIKIAPHLVLPYSNIAQRLFLLDKEDEACDILERLHAAVMNVKESEEQAEICQSITRILTQKEQLKGLRESINHRTVSIREKLLELCESQSL